MEPKCQLTYVNLRTRLAESHKLLAEGRIINAFSLRHRFATYTRVILREAPRLNPLVTLRAGPYKELAMFGPFLALWSTKEKRRIRSFVSDVMFLESSD